MRKIFFAVATLLLVHSTANAGNLPPGCTINNVQIKKANYKYDTDTARVTVIVNQSCKGAVGVELKWTGYYADGSVAFTDTFWPNSDSNIPANVDFPSEYMHNALIPPVKYSLTVNKVYAW